MNDRAPIRDRTLMLRILVPRLADRLREKMKELEDAVASETTSQKKANNTPSGKSSSGGGNSSKEADTIWDLEGVSCEPTEARNKTLWNFHCDGATYPAKLVNLPCPVELHKTIDHASFYKCSDVAQMLIVYEDDYALDEAEEKPQEGFPSYYHSGLTPPMKKVVERRFAAREHKAVAPPRAAVADVEEELMQLMEQLQKDEKGGSSNKRNKLPSLQSTTKVLEEVEEVVVTYEPWMDDGGKQPDGVEFDIDDPLATNHPEIFLTPTEIKELKEQDLEAQREIERKKQEAAEKKEKKAAKRNKKKEAAAAAAEEKKAAADSKPQKKGIASKKNKKEEEVDQITQAAMTAMSAEDLIGDVAMDDDFFGDLDLDLDDMGGI